MPKLPKDEILFTPQQLAHFNQKCDCGATLGQHREEGRNCPLPTGKGFASDKTYHIAGSTNFDSADLTPATEVAYIVGDTVQINPDRVESRGVVVEVVPPNSIPTTKGLRHIADKRRQPKPRKDVTYVVKIGDKPTRANLYWPTTVHPAV